MAFTRSRVGKRAGAIAVTHALPRGASRASAHSASAHTPRHVSAHAPLVCGWVSPAGEATCMKLAAGKERFGGKRRILRTFDGSHVTGQRAKGSAACARVKLIRLPASHPAI